MNLKKGINILYGPNGSGKTTLLEALCLASLGRSFKTNTATDYISKKEKFYNISIKTNNNTKIEIKGEKYKKAIFVNNQIIKKISSHIYLLPAIINTPDESVLEGKNNFNRNKNINKNIVLISPKNLKTIKEFSLILKQRNAAIKNKQDFFIWNKQFSEKAQKIWVEKIKYEKEINHHLKTIKKEFGLKKDIKIEIKGTIKDIVEIKQNLINSKEKDIEKQTTTTGPQKDKIKYTLFGDEIKNKASQGEKSLFFSALKKAEARTIKQTTKKEPIILLDDILSKLDNKNTTLVLNVFKRNQQTIITHTEKIKKENIHQIKING